MALRRSIDINPANAALTRSVERMEPGRRGSQRRLALVTGRRWPASKTVLSVSFMDNPSVALRKRILDHMNAWNLAVNIRFEETQSTGEVRIGRFSNPPEWAGYWSWLGTEILTISEDEPTLNLEAFTMKTSEAEFKRVVRHEAGHTLGFDHEHMRSDLVAKINRKKAFAYFKRTEGWSQEETREQVLTPLKEKSLMGTTESDPLSIMCYQIPGERISTKMTLLSPQRSIRKTNPSRRPIHRPPHSRTRTSPIQPFPWPRPNPNQEWTHSQSSSWMNLQQPPKEQSRVWRGFMPVTQARR
jgi:Astacin (Peptidase family M12A)